MSINQKDKKLELDRRNFIRRTAAVGVLTGAVAKGGGALAKPATDDSRCLEDSVSRVKSIVRRDGMLVKYGGDGVGASTWTRDDRQLLIVSDGAGWPEVPEHGYSSSDLFAATGGPEDARFEQISTYPRVRLWPYMSGKSAPYYALTSLAVDGQIYQYMSTGKLYSGPEEYKRGEADQHFYGAKLIFSPDNGKTWCNQDGSSPVVLEMPVLHSHETLAFVHEPNESFSILSFLQMGRDYQDNRDGYVYVYSPNGITDGTMNELVMFRVPKGRIRVREEYEYFAGLMNGDPRWSKDIEKRRPIHTFPSGFVAPGWTVSWFPSVVYNAPLGLYMMTAGSGGDTGANRRLKTYFGIWAASQPWGPWRQFYEESPDTGLGGGFAPKWITPDGKSFWLACGGGMDSTATEDVLMLQFAARTEQEFFAGRSLWRQYTPGFSFNVQRYDIVV